MSIKDAIFYDKEDYALIHMIENILTGEDSQHGAIAFDTYLHPNGIKQFFLPRQFRIAFAIAKILGGMNRVEMEDRLKALRSLQEETMYAVLEISALRYNTGRVLVKVMKELIKARGDFTRQLHLAHSFQRAARGNLYIVRRLLEEYSLLEMPEEKSQLSFDYHVHDMYSKGSKNPSQVLLDAFIQGVRTITVIYYNCVDEKALEELIRAGEILDITVQFGIEYHLPLRNTFAEIIWTPTEQSRNLQAMRNFFQRSDVISLMEKGKYINNSIAQFTFAILEEYNSTIRFIIQERYNINTQYIDKDAFIIFVAEGKISPQYLAEYIYSGFSDQCLEVCRYVPEESSENKRIFIKKDVKKDFSLETLLEMFTISEDKGILPSPYSVKEKTTLLTNILGDSVYDIIEHCVTLEPNSFICLNIGQLTTEEVLCLLWDARGNITHLELFNLKDWLTHTHTHIESVSKLQYALNTQDIQELKRIVRGIVQEVAISEDDNKEERLAILNTILASTPQFLHFYREKTLQVQLGSDSAGGIDRDYSMGFVFEETIPTVRHDKEDRFFAKIPVRANLIQKVEYKKREEGSFWDSKIGTLVRKFPLLPLYVLGREQKHYWSVEGDLFTIVPQEHGNIIGTGRTNIRKGKSSKTVSQIYRDLNTKLLIFLKICVALLFAYTTFKLTQENPILQDLGGVLWLSISVCSGISQIVYAIGFEKHSLVKKREYLIPSRFADVLLGTGLSVFIIEYLLRYLLLQNTFHINSASHPFLVFCILGVSSSSILLFFARIRGLSRKIATVQAFRVLVSVPLAIVYQFVFLWILRYCEVHNADAIVSSMTTIISKLASDTFVGTVVAIILKHGYITTRKWDYRKSLNALWEYINTLEELYPEKDIAFLLQQPAVFIRLMKEEQNELLRSLYISLLDIFYFWYYKPRSHRALKMLIATMSSGERKSLSNIVVLLGFLKDNIDDLSFGGEKPENYNKFCKFYIRYHQIFIKDIQKILA
ncbi:MAG: hypothetical protein ACRCV3_00900 [Desulfovibrionaceae bacterium]